ncbi:MAG: HigA family addiction module antidote protein [bacterium]|nr:HigA family addiction module antidote protein [bacterium]
MDIRHEKESDGFQLPGQRLLEVLAEKEMSQVELARRIGRPKKTISEIVKGRTAITADTALQLQQVLGEPAAAWLKLEADHQILMAGARMYDQAVHDAPWLREVPVDAMVAAKWIPRMAGVAERVGQLLGWFGVASPAAWRGVYVEPQARYHRAPWFDANPGTLAAWMRTGELQARTMKTSPYDRKKFQRALEEIRRLTLRPADVWQDRMIELAAGAGVAVAYSRELEGLPVAGATRWLSPRLALIHLSLARETDDQLWFGFFHQAAHLLLHGKKQVYLEGIAPATSGAPLAPAMSGAPLARPGADRGGDAEELAADEFAASFLIPEATLEKLKPFCEGRRISETIVRTFAAELRIAPGIVVGRLQQLGWIPDSWLNDLKWPLGWAPPGTEADPQVY